jgi:hypothetical protein
MVGAVKSLQRSDEVAKLGAFYGNAPPRSALVRSSGSENKPQLSNGATLQQMSSRSSKCAFIWYLPARCLPSTPRLDICVASMATGVGGATHGT